MDTYMYSVLGFTLKMNKRAAVKFIWPRIFGVYRFGISKYAAFISEIPHYIYKSRLIIWIRGMKLKRFENRFSIKKQKQTNKHQHSLSIFNFIGKLVHINNNRYLSQFFPFIPPPHFLHQKVPKYSKYLLNPIIW